jgi:hypothetical protein
MRTKHKKQSGKNATRKNRGGIMSNNTKNVPEFDNTSIVVKSYVPTINQQLVSLKSIDRESFNHCNNKNAFLLKEPLQVMVDHKCHPYYYKAAQELLLTKLKANKHLNASKMITPIQSHSNCWFNTMFVVFFMSDHGRKFFHFFRQMMIEGKQITGENIPSKLWSAFALLNYAIECCLTGNEYAYKVNTNSIIRQIYLSIPESYKKKGNKYLVDVDFANNPVYYYESIMNYLQVNGLERMILHAIDENWRAHLETKIAKSKHPPHYIVIEIFDGHEETPGSSGKIKNKETKIVIGNYVYELDSAIIRDIEQNHFSAVLTVENKEYAYDGASFHRVVPMKWKRNLNKTTKWGFKGSDYPDKTPLQWSFRHGYQMLFYYRTK